VNVSKSLMRLRELRSPQSAESAMLKREQGFLTGPVNVVRSSGPDDRTPCFRSIKETQPGPCSSVRNVVNPMESDGMLPSKRHSTSKPTARKAEFFSGNGMIQEAKAASRKATGRHNRADRANSPTERLLTWIW